MCRRAAAPEALLKLLRRREHGLGVEPREDGIVGVASIVDCITRMNSSWFHGPFGFLLEDARPLPLVPFRGQLGFFHVPDHCLADPRAARLDDPLEAF